MIGREQETNALLKLYERDRAEFVAIYGRRRVGKTFLVSETFSGKITFLHSGLSPVEQNKNGATKAQLEHFYHSLILHGAQVEKCPESWLEAFFLLEKFLEENCTETRQVVFLDELPWMDTPRSGFITALEGFWNTWGCHNKKLMLVVCGSSSSWMQDHLIHNHGGLYGRVTRSIRLSPFTLRECEAFYRSSGFLFSRYDIIQSYMIFGGIPYYMDYLEPDQSIAQNVDRLFFEHNAILGMEYDQLFSSIFDTPDLMKSIVEFLSTRNSGYTRKEICQKLSLSSGGTLTNALNALIASDFVQKYKPFGESGKNERYKLIDPFCRFYLHFLHRKKKMDDHYWMHSQLSPEIVSWRGFAFEQVCFNHIPQIKEALKISEIQTNCSAWSKKPDDSEGTQLDLLIERADNVLNACEIKYYSGNFTVDKAYYQVLMNRFSLLAKELSPKVSIYPTLITTYGLSKNEYSNIFVKVLSIDDLFSF